MRYFYTILIVILYQSTYSQSLSKDSLQVLEKNLSNISESTKKLEVLQILFEGYFRQDLDKSDMYSSQAVSLAEKLKDIERQIVALHNMGEIALRKNKMDVALNHYQNALDLSKEINHSKSLAMSYQKLGNWYNTSKSLEQAINYYNQSIEIRKAIGDNNGIAAIYNNMASIYQQNQEFDKALDLVNKSTEIRRASGNERELALTLRRKGAILMLMGKLDDAILVFEESKILCTKANDMVGLSITIDNLGTCYLEKGDYKSSIPYFEESSKLYVTTKDFFGKAASEFHLSEAYTHLGDFKKSNEYALSAIKYLEDFPNARAQNLLAKLYEQQLMIHAEYGDSTSLYWYEKSLSLKPSDYDLGNIHFNYANWLLKQNQNTEALKHAKLAYDLKEKTDPITSALSIAQYGIMLHRNNKSDDALPYLQEGLKALEKINSSVQKPRIQNEIANILSRRDRASKEKALALALESIQEAKKSGSLTDLTKAYQQASISYDSLGNKKKALAYLQYSQKIADSIFKVSDHKEIAVQEAKHEVQSELDQSKEIQEKKDQEILAQKKSKTNWIIYSSLALLLSTLVFYSWNRYKTKEQNLRLSNASKKIAQAELALLLERNRISKDLHDEVGSTLSSISILSHSSVKHLEDQYEKARLSEISSKARDAMQSISDIIWSVNPTNETLEKLIQRIIHYASETLEAIGAEFKINTTGDLSSFNIPVEQRKDLYLILKEILNNIAKYSHAKNVMLYVDINQQECKISITEDGIGFDVARAKEKIQCNGLKNVWARAKALSANISMQSEPGHGSKFLLSFTNKSS